MAKMGYVTNCDIENYKHLGMQSPRAQDRPLWGPVDSAYLMPPSLRNGIGENAGWCAGPPREGLASEPGYLYSDSEEIGPRWVP